MKALQKRCLQIKLVLLSALLLTVMAGAQPAKAGALTLDNFWALPSVMTTPTTNTLMMQAMPGGPTTEVFGSFLNSGNVPDTLTKVTSPAFKAAELILWVRGSQMTSALPLQVPQGKSVSLSPNTQFIRLYGLSKSYKDGDHISITFHFQHAAEIKKDVIVRTK